MVFFFFFKFDILTSSKIKVLPQNNFYIDVEITWVTREVGILRSLKQSSAIKT